MRLRNLAAGLALGAGAVAATNRALRSRADPLPPALVGEQGTYRWRGIDVAYAEAGDPDDPDVLLLHGVHAAASSQEFDRIFDRLAENHHVLAPDLPGFGRSERPPVTYTATTFEEFVADFAAAHTEDAVCVATSLTGAYAASVARDRPDLFSRLVLVCPTDDAGDRRRWLRSLFRSPLVGEALFNLLVSRRSLAWYDSRDGYEAGADRATIDYQWRTSHQPGARYAPASFVSGYLTPGEDLADVLQGVDAPVTLVWGRQATRTPLAVGRALAEVADTRLVTVDRARLLPHAEHPEAFLRAVAGDLPRVEAE